MKKFIVLALAVIVGLCFSQPTRAAMEQGDKKFEVSGEVRFRGDYIDNVTDFDSDDAFGPDAGATWPWRVRAAIHGSFSRNVSAHVEFQNFGVAGDGDQVFPNSGSSGGNTELYQGWLELGDIGGGSFDLRMGRQELVYGSEFLLGDNDFYTGTVHDGFRAAWQYKKWTLDVFATKFAESATFFGDVFPDSSPSDSDTNFYGAYAVFKAPKKLGFDAYGLYLQDQTDERRWTFGGRVYSKWDSNWMWSAEAAAQTGEFTATGTDISGAFGFEGELAYQWRKSKIRPRVYGRYSIYTGDDSDPAESEAFSPLFQDFHARNGYSDVVRATDLNILRAGVSWAGKEDRHVFGVDVLQFTLNEDLGGEDDIGSELDLSYKYAYSKNVSITAAIASFQPGDIFDGASAASPVFGGAVAPDLVATGDDSATRVYVNTRLRW